MPNITNTPISNVNFYQYKEEPVPVQIKKILINHYAQHLVEKGILDHNAKTVIQPHKLNALIATAMQEQTGLQTQSAFVKGSVKNILTALGYPLQSVFDIPAEAYDTLAKKPKYGTQAHNRIAYMRMTDVPEKRYGLLLGGIGTGGTGMFPDGSFPEINFLDLGRNAHDPKTNRASGFHIYCKQDGKNYSRAFSGENDLRYHALYPMTWHELTDKKIPAQVGIQSFSPVIPGNYQESSYPVIVFKIKIKNPTNKPMEVGTLFSFKNLAGHEVLQQNAWDAALWQRKINPGIQSIFPKSEKTAAANLITTLTQSKDATRSSKTFSDEKTQGIVLSAQSKNNVEGSGSIVLALPKDKRYQVSVVSGVKENDFDALKNEFSQKGEIKNSPNAQNEVGAIAFKATLAAGEEIEVPMVMAYDFPVSEFSKGNIKEKKYTTFFQGTKEKGKALALEALKNYKGWEAQIKEFQNKITKNPNLPSWMKGELLNTLSLLQSNAIYWGKTDGREYHVMGESNMQDYVHAETRDVGVYTGARRILWPELHKNLMRYYADTVKIEDPKEVPFYEMDGKVSDFLKEKKVNKEFKDLSSVEKRQWIKTYLIEKDKRTPEKAELLSKILFNKLKVKGAIPHDIGAYGSDPVKDINSYTHQNPNEWSELSMCLPIESYLNYFVTGKKDLKFLNDTYQQSREAMNYVHEHFVNESGLPQHRGIPDQTYDNWNVEGAMTYTSFMYLVALKSSIEMAKKTGNEKDIPVLEKRLGAAQKSLIEKLWIKEEKRFRLSENSDDSFADVLPMLYSKMLGMDLVPDEMVRSHLKSVFENNVKKFGTEGYARGYQGAINGMRQGKEIDGEQEKEMWVGTSYALGTAMLAYGLEEEGWQTIFGTYNLTTNLADTWGMWAEAYTQEPGIGNGPMYGFRARTYYRVLANWNVWILETLRMLKSKK